MKKLGIFLVFVMVLSMLPASVNAAESYVETRNSITFDLIKNANVSQFNITSDLFLPSTLTSPDGSTEHRLVWESSNPAIITNDGRVIARTAVDEWVTMKVWVYHEDTANHEHTCVDRDIPVRVLADSSKVDTLLAENFNNVILDETTKTAALTNTTESSTDWYLNSTASPGTTFTFIEDEAYTGTGNIAMRLDPNETGNNVFAVRKLPSTPVAGLISYSVDVLFAGTSAFSAPFWPFWHVKGNTTITYPASNGNSSANFTFNLSQWYNVTTLYNLDNQRIDTYINGKWVFGYDSIPPATKNSLDSVRFRMQSGTNYVNSFAYIDNIEVKTILTNEKSDLAKWNPATKGSAYVTGNLPMTATLNGTDYPVARYISSDESVIAADGTVTRPDFFRTVNITPQIDFDGITVNGTEWKLTVLPQKYIERLYEDFSAMSVGDMFNTDGSSKYTGWTQNQTSANYQTAQTAGNRSEIVLDGDEKVLRMLNAADSKDYRLQKTISNPDCGDRVALSMRIKNVGTTPINLSSPYMGRLRNSQTWRGDFGNTGLGSDVEGQAQFATKNTWQTFLFVFDTDITDTKNSYENCHPISLYVDGVYLGTSWTRALGASWGGMEELFQLLQFGANGKSDVYIDDILLINFDAGDVQFGATTVTDNQLTAATLQYNSYGNASISGTLMVGAYDAKGALIRAESLGTVSVPVAGDTNFTGYSFDLSGAASYRLFLFSDIAELKPLASSKIFLLK